ncbi:MAG TPA: PQQ-binding-like beta-propeller repeat protein [Ktedonobacteraceae bacterium]|nr:PQQ-binding-like beta-propeller repeat protein [Ktedonobacteraceae bacterium]
MSHRFKSLLLTVGFCALLAPLLASCDIQTAPSHPQQPRPVSVAACHGTLRPASATGTPSRSVPRSIYFGTSQGELYAVNAQTGSPRWCITLISVNHTSASVGTPAIVDGVVFVCASIDGQTNGSLYALNASDGALRWQTRTYCSIGGLGDAGLPLVNSGVVYSGYYAVREQDGQPLWEVPSALVQESIFLAVSNGVLYGCTYGNVFALNTANGSMLWRYPPYKFNIQGAKVVSPQLIVVGTQEPVNVQTSALYVLNTDTGTLRWYFLMGSYVGATYLNNVVYVGAGDGYVYAFDAKSGNVLWHDHFATGAFTYGAFAPALSNGVLYINGDGAYALRSDTGSVLWHNTLGTKNSEITPPASYDYVSFQPSTVSNGIDYVAITGRGAATTLYALNASTGAEEWHSQLFPQLYSSLAVA